MPSSILEFMMFEVGMTVQQKHHVFQKLLYRKQDVILRVRIKKKKEAKMLIAIQ